MKSGRYILIIYIFVYEQISYQLIEVPIGYKTGKYLGMTLIRTGVSFVLNHFPDTIVQVF